MRPLLTLSICCTLLTVLSSATTAEEPDLFSLDQSNPWYPDVNFPALKTPAWVDEAGVECVVVLAIDDMRDSAKYEHYLRPILNRLKQIDGRAPVSIMTNSVKPDDPQLQSWLEEGLSIEVHTADHPCPILNSGDQPKAKSTYDRCIDQLHQIPGNRPVAFRTPCCDSLNTVSPRFFGTIFNRETPGGHRLQIDSSVFNFFTSADSSLPDRLVLDSDGNERFLKYMVRNNRYGGVVHDRFVNYIENYPYPYVINGCCWQFPCVAPSDWSAQHLHGVNNPRTVEDWKAALDLTVLKQGVFNLVFHPHGWITAEQVVELIDHAVQTHGSKVKFLTFKEAADRLNRTQTNGQPLFDATAEDLAKVSHRQRRKEQPGRGDLRNLSSAALQSLRKHGGLDTQPLVDEDGRHNGVFVFDDLVCWQNEHTDRRPDLLQHTSIRNLETVAAEHRRLQQLPLIPVGAASVDITPDYPVRLTGYGNRKAESEGVAARIHARAIVLGGLWHAAEDTVFTGQPLTAIVTVDNCGVPAEIVEAAFQRLARDHDLSRERFAVCSTHTHSGPWLRGFAPNVLLDLPAEHAAHLKQYEAELIDHIATVVTQAIAKRRPAKLSRTTGRLSFAMNRRVVDEGNYRGFGETPDGPVDHQFPLLVARDADGKLIALLSNYACHATTETGNFNQISGDWPGFAADYIEAELPGITALIAISCGADANPSPRGTHEQAQQHGRSVADETLRLLQADEFEPIDPRIQCRMAQVDLPLGPVPTREELEQTAAGNNHAAALARRFLQQLEDGKELPTSVPDYPIQTWTFGDTLAMVFLGGEVVVDYSIRLNDMLDDQRLWINAYANDVPCYIASKRILREGGYEADSSMVYYAHPTRLAPEAEDVICDTVQRLLPHSYYSKDLQKQFPAPKNPEESRQCISVRPEFKVQLVAAEPFVTDPVAFDWDITGHLYVVEMGGYPNGPRDQQPFEGGRVRLLTDRTGDGQYDAAVTFLDGLAFPTGICRWRSGVLITDAPNIIYAEDTDGDGVADVKQILFQGFNKGNQQHRVNGLRYGLDNWVHIGNGDSGGKIAVVAALQPHADSDNAATANTSKHFWWPGIAHVGESASISGRDARLRPDEGLLDPTFGRTQFGRERDDWGHWFGNNNSNPLWHYIGEDRWFRGEAINPRRTRQDVPTIPGAAPVYPTSTTLARFNDFDRANRFTSACSSMIYRDTLLGQEYLGNSFTCEPVHNLVSRLVLTADGLSFRGHRAEGEAESEFFASSDNWTRPSMVRTGPDGGLYVADMYRQVIEHPEWIPAEWQRKLDVRAGASMGRIYRIVPENFPDDLSAESCCGGQTDPQIAAAVNERRFLSDDWQDVSDDHLLQRLTSRNGWWRDTAQRILVHRGSRPNVVQVLQHLLQHGDHPETRLHALCTLAELEPDDPHTILIALNDDHAEVQRHAVRLSERFLRAGHSEVSNAVLELHTSQNAQLLLQVASVWKLLPAESASAKFSSFLKHVQQQPDVLTTALTALNSQNGGPVLLTLLSSTESNEPLSAEAEETLWQAASRLLDGSDLARLLSAAVKSLPVQAESFTRLADRLEDIRQRESAWSALQEVAKRESVWQEFAAGLKATALDATHPEELRAAAVRLSSRLPVDADQNATADFHELLSSQQPPSVRLAAVDALLQHAQKGVPAELLNSWSSRSPQERDHILAFMLSRPQTTDQLLQSLQDQQIDVGSLPASIRERLVTHANQDVKDLAIQLLGDLSTTPRQTVVTDYLARVNTLTGDAARGQAIFEKRCSACHRLQNIGRQIGADLAAVKDRSTAALVTAILDPNRAVEAKFLSYTAVTSKGQTFNGMVVSETGSAVTLLGTDGKQEVIDRSQLDELICSNRSLMPEGLEKDLAAQDLADVISFVQTSGVPWKSFAGNQPQVVRQTDDGRIVLPATAAEIYGPSLVFEDRYQNLGWWTSTDDYAVWKLDVPRSGMWTVEFEYACDSSTAGSPVKLSTGTRLLSARVPGTGTWDDYRRWQLGQIDLHRGRQQLIVSAPEKPAAALIDLKAIHLIPPQ